MNPADFQAPVAGRVVRLPQGYAAFLPAPPPPPIDYDHALVLALSRADAALSELAGLGRVLPNPHLLIGPYVRREAVLSSRIEGTRTEYAELLLAEVTSPSAVKPVTTAEAADRREIQNYVAAMEYGIARLAELPLSLRLVRELHARLMAGVRGGHATPGEFRRSQNWIGAPGSTLANATYVPPPPNELSECLDAFEKFLHDRALPPLVQIGLLHSQFEAIHPFLDGNGRVGRLLITLFLIERSVLPSPLLYLSAFFEATRQDYYDRLLGVTERGEWENWLEYFLNGVARQSEDALDRASRINALLDRWRRQTAGSRSPVTGQMVELLAENPFWSIKRAAARLEVAYTTAERAIERLEAASVLRPVSRARRDRVFCARALLRILEEPARLVPLEGESQ
jgi:Fic family protein